MAIPEGYPQPARAALAGLLDKLAPLAPEPAAVLVYGSLAKGTWRKGESDVNVLVVVHEASAATLDALAGPLREAWRQALVRPMILERAEIPRLGDVFPIKLADIQRDHDVLAGDDPLAGVTIERAHVRLRLEQQLRNQLLQLRRQLVFGAAGERELARALVGAARSLPYELATLLELRGKPSPQQMLADMAGAVAAEIDVPAETLQRLASFKRGTTEADVRGLYHAVIALVSRAVDVVDRLETA